MDDEGILEFPQRPGGVEVDRVHAVEALLFAAPEPVTTAVLAEALELAPGEVEVALRVLELRRRSTGVELCRVAGGWQLRTAPRFAGPVAALRGVKPDRLSRAALEALSIIAWRQPVTRPEVERLRGVDSGGVLKTLLQRGLIKVAGRSTDPGRPLVYRTTRQFLEVFSLPDLSALPTLEQLTAAAQGGEDG